jgi:hypothetical protein
MIKYLCLSFFITSIVILIISRGKQPTFPRKLYSRALPKHISSRV